eukprot:4500833-Alexandrium_andersonii.AAC.1
MNPKPLQRSVTSGAGPVLNPTGLDCPLHPGTTHRQPAPNPQETPRLHENGRSPRNPAIV